MTTQIQLPAHIAARVAARNKSENQKSSVAAAILTGGYEYPKISIKASKYRLVEDGVETVVGATLDVVFVGANDRVSKVFYNKPYDPNDTSPPDCFSLDGIRPDASIEAPVCESCAACPNNVLGSKMNPGGAKSKKCADQRHMAVVPAADPSKVYGLTVPVSGMKGLREYFKSLANFGVNPEETVTQLGFDDDASFPKITYALKGYVPEASLPVIEQIAQSDEVKIAIRKMAGPSAPALAAPKEAPTLPAVATEPEAPATKAAKPAKVKEEPAAEEPAQPTASAALQEKLASLFG